MSETSLKPGDLPSTWALTSLGAVVDYGSTTKSEPSQISSEDWVLELEDIEKDSSRLLQRITFGQRQSKSTKSRFQSGDLLYGKLRPYLNKVLIADRAGYCTTEIVPIRTGPHLDNRYLFYWLKHPAFLKYVEAKSHGMNMPRLGTDTAKAAPFVLAPRSEQTRIADQLDKLLARVQACNDRIDQVPSTLKRFRQSVLAAATSGRLTQDWRDEAKNSSEWSAVRLSDVIVEMRNGLAAKPTETSPGAKILRISAVRAGRLDLTDHRYLVVNEKDAVQYSLKENDLLFTRYNGSLEYVGVCALVRSNANGYVYPDKLIRVRLNRTKANAQFIEIVFGSEHVRHQIENFVKSSAGQKGISGTDLKSTHFMLPPIDEQSEIVRRVEALFKLADRIEARYMAARAQAQRLTPLLLAKAFRGELVQQDPQDEPASVLLERIATTKPAKARTSRERPRIQKRPPAIPELDPIDWASLPNGAWAAPADPDGQAAMVWLTAVLRAWGEPMPEREARLAVMLCQQPRLFAAVLPAAQATQWSRLVGDEARPLPTQVLPFQPAINGHWARAIKGMRARDDLVEADLGDGITWALGPSAASIETAGWPDGRAGFVVAYLRAHGIASVLPLLEPSVQEFVDARAA
jgi:type I restriction enzyme S subunit